MSELILFKKFEFLFYENIMTKKYSHNINSITEIQIKLLTLF